MEEANPRNDIWLRSEGCKGASPAERSRAFQAPCGVSADVLNLEFVGRIQGMTGTLSEAEQAARGGRWPGGADRVGLHSKPSAVCFSKCSEWEGTGKWQGLL